MEVNTHFRNSGVLDEKKNNNIFSLFLSREILSSHWPSRRNSWDEFWIKFYENSFVDAELYILSISLRKGDRAIPMSLPLCFCSSNIWISNNHSRTKLQV